MTTRLVDEEGFRRIGSFLVRARDLALHIQTRRHERDILYIYNCSTKMSTMLIAPPPFHLAMASVGL